MQQYDILIWVADDWLPLDGIDLDKIWPDEGVYIIRQRGHETNPNPCIYVGQGDIARRLDQHRYDPKLRRQYDPTGQLQVKWAYVPPEDRDGVERFLVNELRPLEGARHPDVNPIPVNLPKW